MMHLKLKLFVTALAFMLPTIPANAVDDNVITFSEDDVAMNAAIAKARSSLPVFWKKYLTRQANEDGFALKIKIVDGQAIEHFWCNEITGDENMSTCVIANDPELVTTVAYGQEIQVNPDDISDWKFERNGKIIGGETIRVMIPKLSKQEADEIQAMMSDDTQ